MKLIVLQAVAIVTIMNFWRVTASWDDEDEYDEDESESEDVFGDSEDDFDHDILDKTREWDLSKEKRLTKAARDFMWIGDPTGSPRDIDLRSDKFLTWREQVKEVLEMDEDDDLPARTTMWLNEKGEEILDVFYRKAPSSYFWRITSPDGVPSYILGTIQAPYTEVYPGLADNVKKAFEISDGYGWMDMDSKSPHYKYDPKNPDKPHLDQYLASLAKSQGKKIYGLETFDQSLIHRKKLNALLQLALDDHPTMRQEDIAEYLIRRDELKDEERGNQASVEEVFGIEDVLVRPSAEKKEARDDLVWQYQNTEVLYPFDALRGELGLHRSLPKSFRKKWREEVLDPRSRSIAQKMYGLMSSNPDVTFFFAVGVYHLLGREPNLITELQEFQYKTYSMSSLYTITRIPKEVSLEVFHVSEESRATCQVPRHYGEVRMKAGKARGVETVERPDVTDLIALLYTGTREWEVGDVKQVRVDSERVFTLDLQLFDHIFELFDPDNKNVTESLLYNMANHHERLKYLQAPDVLLAKLFIQVMKEVPPFFSGVPSAFELHGAVEMVQTLMLEFGELDLASKVDREIENYVEAALLATVGDKAPLKPFYDAVLEAYEKEAPWKSGSNQKLGEFLGRVVLNEAVSNPLPLPLHKSIKYLAVNPVLTGMFANSKNIAVFLLEIEAKRRMQMKAVKDALKRNKDKDAVDRLRWKPLPRNWNSPITLNSWNTTQRAIRL